MKKLSIILVFAVLFSSCGDDKNPKVAYDRAANLTVNSLALLYSFTIFQEAESIWERVNIADYSSEKIIDKNVEGISSNSREIQYELTENQSNKTHHINVLYNWWLDKGLQRMGNMQLIPSDIRQYGLTNKILRVNLQDFKYGLSLEHRFSGTLSISCQSVLETEDEEGEKKETRIPTSYFVSLENGKITDVSTGKEVVLATFSFRNMTFERIVGSDTTNDTSDDVWAVIGNIQGKLYEQESLSFTNTIERQQKAIFSPLCLYPEAGVGRITNAKNNPDVPELLYQFLCDKVEFYDIQEAKE